MIFCLGKTHIKRIMFCPFRSSEFVCASLDLYPEFVVIEISIPISIPILYSLIKILKKFPRVMVMVSPNPPILLLCSHKYVHCSFLFLCHMICFFGYNLFSNIIWNDNHCFEEFDFCIFNLQYRSLNEVFG